MTLKHIKVVAKPNGRVFTYLAVPGRRLVRLPDLPRDSAEFLAAYAAALAQAKPDRRGVPAPTGSIAATMLAYQQSDAFLQLGRLTRASRRAIIAKIIAKAGDARIADLRARHIEADLSGLGPHAANNRRKVWRGLCAWAREKRLIAADPSLEVDKRTVPKSRGHETWTAADIEVFRAHWPIGAPERLAMELLYWTAARASDAVRLGPGMLDKQGWLSFRQQKTGGDVAIPFARHLPAFAARLQPDIDTLTAAIEASPARHMTWIVTMFGAARSDKAFSSWFAAAARKSGVSKSAHGLRKARASALAEAGATAHQIAAWTGHESLSEVQRYARAADKRRILGGGDSEAPAERRQNANWKPSLETAQNSVDIA